MSDIGTAGVGLVEISLALVLSLALPVGLFAFLIFGALLSPTRGGRDVRRFRGKPAEDVWRALLARRLRGGALWMAAAAIPEIMAQALGRPGFHFIAVCYLIVGLTQVWGAARDVQRGWAAAQGSDLAHRAQTLSAGADAENDPQETPA